MDRPAGRTLETFVANRRAPRPGKIKAPSKVVNVVLLGLLRSDPAPASVAREPGGNAAYTPRRPDCFGNSRQLFGNCGLLGRNVAIEQYKWPFDEFF